MTTSNEEYKGVESRTFLTSIIQLLEQEYKLIGSHKVIKMIAEDIDQLHLEFYPEKASKHPGEIQWMTTSVENKKPRLGQKLEEYENTIVTLPYITQEDIKRKQAGITSKELNILRVERLTKSAKEQGGLLTIEELALIMNRSKATISNYINEYQEQNKEVLPLKGYVLDMGRGTTHKKIIIELYEENVAPPDIARRTYHDLQSVDRYIKAYEKIKFLLDKGLSKGEIIQTTDKSKSLVTEYLEIIKKYHPEHIKK
ncbi:DUF1670 domain-containing protein [Fuchsiella alkaliacetigena]|uniref:DUF1670 domain-containing protein n=1 Tax=Fuchsiella alkaliacetigena TaxID=957042 RepID=UPI00200B00B0|nr:DUF1670 domain-containing protein [Fuchsiella alkaliacetigena]MCK8826118.1 DUF1670 domain-containing protein [Fuchsiella alkaliacetigena]